MDSFNWKSFVYYVNSKAIVPIIGNDLSIVKISKDKLITSPSYTAYIKSGEEDGKFLRINLYKYLAIRLWDIQENGPIHVPITINSVALHLMENKMLDGPLMGIIRNEITALTSEEIVLDPYIKLCSIIGFETFVTVNYDNFLERAFEATGQKINKPINLSLPPFPSLNITEKKDAALPRIYNLMGSIKENSFAFTDELSLEYLYMMQNETNTSAKELFDLIYRKSILLIGSSFPDWFMRFFIRTLSNERFKASSSSKYVACDSTLHDAELRYFLENNATQVIPIDSTAEVKSSENHVYKSSLDFISEMYDQCNMVAKAPKNAILFQEIVFISYSWTDKKLASQLKNEFEKNGVNVWFDEDELKTGELYNQTIMNYVKECNYFVALLSQNSIADPTRYVVDKEWRPALTISNYFNKDFIRPFIIDHTDPMDPKIPEEMRSMNLSPITDFNDLGSIVRKFIEENKLTKIAS